MFIVYYNSWLSNIKSMALPLIESSLKKSWFWTCHYREELLWTLWGFTKFWGSLSHKALYLCKLVGAVFGRGKADKHIKLSNYLKLSNIAFKNLAD